MRADMERLRRDWPEYLDWFFSSVFTEPHSTKPFEDGVRYGWATSGEVLELGDATAGCENDVRALARRHPCPTLVIHGDGDKRVPIEKGQGDPRPGARRAAAHGRRRRPPDRRRATR